MGKFELSYESLFTNIIHELWESRRPPNVAAQFYPWFNFYFPLFLTHYQHYHTHKQRIIRIEPRIKLPQHQHFLTRIRHFKEANRTHGLTC